MSNDSAGRDELIAIVETLIFDLERSARKIRESKTLGAINGLGEAFEKYVAELKVALSRQSSLPDAAAWRYGATLYTDYEDAVTQQSYDNSSYFIEPLYLAPPDTVPRAELEQYRKDAERWRTIAGLLLWSPQIDGEIRWSMQIKMPEPDMYNPKAALTDAIDRAGKEGK